MMSCLRSVVAIEGSWGSQDLATTWHQWGVNREALHRDEEVDIRVHRQAARISSSGLARQLVPDKVRRSRKTLTVEFSLFRMPSMAMLRVFRPQTPRGRECKPECVGDSPWCWALVSLKLKVSLIGLLKGGYAMKKSEAPWSCVYPSSALSMIIS